MHYIQKKFSVAALAAVWTMFALVSCTGGYDKADIRSDAAIQMFPDYSGVTFPVNIAPANFRIDQPGDAYQVVMTAGGKEYFRSVSTDNDVRIPLKKWQRMLTENRGDRMQIAIGVKRNGKWTEYRTVSNEISSDSIDAYLAYRLIYPGYELWNEVGIYQRNLADYEEIPILDNRSFGKQCVNCHTFNRNSTRQMMIHVRGKNSGTLISWDGKVKKVNPRCDSVKMGATYAGWHPSGRFIAFSMNDIQQFFHSSGQKPIEVSDLAADLGVYDIGQDKIITSDLLSGDDAMETFPTWSPDGRMLYFCRGNAFKAGTPLDSLRYDLWRVSFDEATCSFGTPECVYGASATRHSVSLPRVSPDGRYVVFVVADYGNFSIWHRESDLYILDLRTGSVRRIDEINSDDVESFHTWSSSGRWLVFSSKRMDGGCARPYFAHFNAETGRFDKPFVLPQKDPSFYDTFLKTYNLPELITSPVENSKQLLDAIGYQE